MPVLHSIPNVPREVLAAVGVVVLVVALSLWARYGRRRYVVIKQSETTEMIALHLGRIADALTNLERRATSQETQPPADHRPPVRSQFLSMFGR